MAFPNHLLPQEISMPAKQTSLVLKPTFPDEDEDLNPRSSTPPPPPPPSHLLFPNGSTNVPTWLNTAIHRDQQTHHCSDNTRYVQLHTASDSSEDRWLHIPAVAGEVSPAAPTGQRRESGWDRVQGDWQSARYKTEIMAHPLYEQLLSAHVACLRIATPIDQLPRIDAQLAQSREIVAKYSVLCGGGAGEIADGDGKELDRFMTHYVLLLCSFREQLQQHVRVHAMEAVMACWELEQSLQSLTGISPNEGTGATMSDDEDDNSDSGNNFYDGNLDEHDSMGFGLPTESERTLMERVREELKHELKQGYKEKIVDIREEILRKRRAGKLPGETTSLLKAWWKSHSKWPYPTEEDKALLVQETGLQLKQINNWFINQRKRNWHSSPSSSTMIKSKRKSNAGHTG
ncbi:hypothetical protein M5K25_014303 [Dendrobium thyrsiflorum]|uniref:Homeobox protein knotted-1-like 3 n=1 Tax=Dendrobium thyrsiflorum TaxID=117978 RepID=A0ABD0V2D2_DENTH